MIANQREYEITKVQLERFQVALERLESSEPSPRVHPRVHQAMCDAAASEITELQDQIARYEELPAGS